MKLYGITVPQSVFDAADAFVERTDRDFTAGEIVLEAERADHPPGMNCYRFADRYLQKRQREGRITHISGGYWRRLDN